MKLIGRCGLTDAVRLFGRGQAAANQFGYGLPQTAPGVPGEAGGDLVQIVGKVDGGSHGCIVMW
jgi:hypothetical protein